MPKQSRRVRKQQDEKKFEHERSLPDIEGKQRAKRFLISRYTSEVAMLMAVAYREEKIQELNKLGADYTEYHGK